MVEAGRGRRGPKDGRTPGADRDLVSGQGRKRGGNRAREGRHRLARGTPWYDQHERKLQTSSGGRQAGEPSRWTVALRLGKMGGGGCKEIKKRFQRLKDGVR